jgi:zinc transport system substrate-binding protein
MRFSRLTSLLATTALLAACTGPGNLIGDKKDADNRLVIAASFYPIAEIVQRVAADTVQLLQLTAPGVEPHDSELSAKQLDELAKADIVFYIGGGFQPDLEKAITSLASTTVAVDLLKSVDVISAEEEPKDTHSDEESDEHDHAHSATDPHVWLDPANMAKMSARVAREIAKVQTSLAPGVNERQARYAGELTDVGTLIDTTFASCERNELVTAHDAFAYFAQRAKITTIPISGVDPENEPSAKELEATAKIAKENNVTTIFFEEILPKEFADTVAAAIGAKVDSINAVETISQDDLDAGASYITIMKSNIAKVATGLGCK